MALHGTIAVNEQVIGGWSAVRGEDTSPPNRVYRYTCEVVRFEPYEQIHFHLHHAYTDGAVALAAAVLTKAQRLMRDEEPLDD